MGLDDEIARGELTPRTPSVQTTKDPTMTLTRHSEDNGSTLFYYVKSPDKAISLTVMVDGTTYMGLDLWCHERAGADYDICSILDGCVACDGTHSEARALYRTLQTRVGIDRVPDSVVLDALEAEWNNTYATEE